MKILTCIDNRMYGLDMMYRTNSCMAQAAVDEQQIKIQNIVILNQLNDSMVEFHFL